MWNLGFSVDIQNSASSTMLSVCCTDTTYKHECFYWENCCFPGRNHKCTRIHTVSPRSKMVISGLKISWLQPVQIISWESFFWENGNLYAFPQLKSSYGAVGKGSRAVWRLRSPWSGEDAESSCQLILASSSHTRVPGVRSKQGACDTTLSAQLLGPEPKSPGVGRVEQNPLPAFSYFKIIEIKMYYIQQNN